MLRRYCFIGAFLALVLASSMSGVALGQSAPQRAQQQFAAQREVLLQLERQLAAQVDQQRRAQAGAERAKRQFGAQQEALERTERQVKAGQVEQLRQAEERGDQQRHEEAEAQRRREAQQHEEEWRAVMQARKQPQVGVEQSPEEQQISPQSEAPQSITPTGSPNAVKSIFARFPLLRLGLALLAALAVFVLGWMLHPPILGRRLPADGDTNRGR